MPISRPRTDSSAAVDLLVKDAKMIFGNRNQPSALCAGNLCMDPAAAGVAELVAFAEKGAPWAETILGRAMIVGLHGIEKQEQTGLEWINKAVAKNYPAAIFERVKFQFLGLTSSSTMSQEECKNLSVKAANLGHGGANARLATCLFHGVDGFETDQVEAYYRASVAFALDGTDHNASYTLGSLYLHGTNFLDASPYLACYYLNISATVVDIFGEQYSNALLSLDRYLHNGDYCEVPGYNVLPALFFWARKASRDVGENVRHVGPRVELKQQKELEKRGQIYCSNCNRDAQADEKFKYCAKCKGQWYCSKECQVEAWKAGHNKDCKRVGILKFEDYLNSFKTVDHED